jgi:hypothetical protein
VATVVVVVVAVGLWIGVPVYRRQVAIREIERVRGQVVSKSGGPAWLRRCIGNQRMHAFDEVVYVDLENTRFDDAGMARPTM